MQWCRRPHTLELINHKWTSEQPLRESTTEAAGDWIPSSTTLLNGQRRMINCYCINCWRVNTAERLEVEPHNPLHPLNAGEGCSPMTNSLCWSWWHWGIMRDYDNDTSHTNYHSPLAREWWWGGGVVMARPTTGRPDETRWPYDPLNKFWQNTAILEKILKSSDKGSKFLYYYFDGIF